MKRFLLVRHGETSWNRENRIQGWAQVSLNEAGRRQGRALATHLAEAAPDVGLIVSSDLPRAVETVEILQEATYPDVPVTVDAGWRERDFGVFQGHHSKRFFEQYPEYAVHRQGRAAAARTPEKGESYLTFRDRVLDQWQTLTEEVTAEEVLLVVHGGVIRVVVAAIDEYDVTEAVETVRPDNGSITEVTFDCSSGTAEVPVRNRRDHLEHQPL